MRLFLIFTQANADKPFEKNTRSESRKWLQKFKYEKHNYAKVPPNQVNSMTR